MGVRQALSNDGVTQVETLRKQGAEEDFWPKTEELTRGCWKLHNEELENWEPLQKMYYSGDKIKENEMGDTLDYWGGKGRWKEKHIGV